MGCQEFGFAFWFIGFKTKGRTIGEIDRTITLVGIPQARAEKLGTELGEAALMVST
jgi:hypothetical protein